MPDVRCPKKRKDGRRETEDRRDVKNRIIDEPKKIQLYVLLCLIWFNQFHQNSKNKKAGKRFLLFKMKTKPTII
jgi:hypothetical protein